MSAESQCMRAVTTKHASEDYHGVRAGGFTLKWDESKAKQSKLGGDGSLRGPSPGPEDSEGLGG
jgi:hypothetical protein